MEVVINGNPQTLDVSDCANLAELVALAGEQLESADASVVVAVSLDGESLSEDEMNRLESHSLTDIGQIAIQCRSARNLAQSVLVQGADYTGRIIEAIDRVVDYYRSSRSDLANELLVNVTDSLSVLTGITSSVANVLREEARTLGRLQAEISPWLEEMIEAQLQEDPIRIADALEYEVRPRVENWGHTMRALAESAVGESAAPLSI